MEKEIIVSLQKHDEKLDRIESLLANQKKILTFDEAARYTGFSKSYLYKLTSKGIIEFSKPNGKTIFFEKDVLENWLLSNKIKSKSTIEKDAISYCTTVKKRGNHGK